MSIVTNADVIITIIINIIIIIIIITIIAVSLRRLYNKPIGIGCLYFRPGLRLPFQLQGIITLWPVPNHTAG